MIPEQRLAKIAEACQSLIAAIDNGPGLSLYGMMAALESMNMVAVSRDAFIEANKEQIEKDLGVKL